MPYISIDCHNQSIITIENFANYQYVQCTKLGVTFQCKSANNIAHRFKQKLLAQ